LEQKGATLQGFLESQERPGVEIQRRRAIPDVLIAFELPDSEVWDEVASGGARQDWLGPEEVQEGERWKNAQRRRDWLRGRYLAKRLLCDHVQTTNKSLRDFQILSRDETMSRGTVPRILLCGQCLPLSLSVAHIAGAVAVALAERPGLRVGIDVVRRQPVSDSFREMWFTELERSMLDEADGDEPLHFWAAKEALYKVLQSDRFEPRRLELSRLSTDRVGRRGDLPGDNQGLELRTWREGEYILALAVARETAELKSNVFGR
jgi:hypothetical protein